MKRKKNVNIRGRGGLFHLNFHPTRENWQWVSSLCNGRIIEDIQHFIGTCPVLEGYRRFWFGYSILGGEDIL